MRHHPWTREACQINEISIEEEPGAHLAPGLDYLIGMSYGLIGNLRDLIGFAGSLFGIQIDIIGIKRHLIGFLQ